MNEQVPGGAPGDMPDWEELRDEEIDPGIRDDLLEIGSIDEEKFWTDEELKRRLETDQTFGASMWLGWEILLKSRGIHNQEGVFDRFNGLSDSFTENKHKTRVEDQIRDIRALRDYLKSLGLSEEELNAKETLKRAYFLSMGIGYEQMGQDAEAMAMLRKVAEEDPKFQKALETFDREARDRERHERGDD